MRPAEARLQASIMISSSIRLSLTGLQVELDEEHVAAADGLIQGDGDLAVGEGLDLGLAQLGADQLGRSPLPGRGWSCR